MTSDRIWQRTAVRCAFALVAQYAMLGLSTEVRGEGSPQSAYDQLCGPHGKASPSTCATLRTELAKPSATKETSAAAASGWSVLPSLAGSWWWGSTRVLLIQKTDKLDWRNKVITGGPGTLSLGVYDHSGKLIYWLMHFTLDRQGLLKTTEGKVHYLPDGALFISKYGFALKQVDANSVDFLPGKLDGGSFVPTPSLALPEHGRFVRLNDAQTVEFNSRVVNAAQQAKVAEAAQQQARQAARGEVFSTLLQGAVAAGQGYVAGMEEANQANTRSQAIIDAAAESDRQYRVAQAAAVVQRGTSQPQSAAQQAQATTRSGAPPAALHAPTPLPPKRSATPPLNASGGGLQPRTVQAYFVWGMALRPNNTRNPRCFSNIFSITYQSALNGNGDAGRADAEAGRLASVFRQKCERLGRMDPGTPPAVIGLPGVPFSAPYITAEDYQVTLP